MGDNEDRKIHVQISKLKAEQIALGLFHTIIRDMDNNVWVCGWNAYGQLGLADDMDTNKLIKIPDFKAQKNIYRM